MVNSTVELREKTDGARPTVQIGVVRGFIRTAGFLPMLVAALLVTGLFVSHFYSTMNMVNVMRQTSYLAIITIGEMLVFIVGGFDLSIGSIVALTSVATTLITATKFTGDGVSLTAFGTLGGLIAAGLVGLVNGVVIALFRVASFIVTLATMGIAAGAALELSGGTPISLGPWWPSIATILRMSPAARWSLTMCHMAAWLGYQVVS